MLSPLAVMPREGGASSHRESLVGALQFNARNAGLTGSPAFAGDDNCELFLRGVGGADLLQDRWRDRGDLGDELLQLFAGQRADGHGLLRDRG